MHGRVLRYLDEVVRSGSIRRAAERLHIAPTAVNRQILQLEDELGAPLFERINNRLKLTPVGELVLAHVRTTLREHELLLARLEEVKGARQGEVSIATTGGLAVSLLPGLIAGFRAQHPGIIIQVVDMASSRVISAVTDGDADLGFTYDVPDMPGLQVLCQKDYRLGAVLHPTHPLASKATLSMSDCVGFPLIFPSTSMSIRALIDNAFQRSRIDIAPAIEATSVAMMCRLVLLNTGLAILNEMDVIEECALGVLSFIPIQDPAIGYQTLKLVMRTKGEPAPATRLMGEWIGRSLAL